MDLTDFIIKRRNEALLVGDYGLYRKQLSRRLLTVRRKLGRTSPKGRKYTTKAPVTAEDIASNEELVQMVQFVPQNLIRTPGSSTYWSSPRNVPGPMPCI